MIIFNEVFYPKFIEIDFKMKKFRKSNLFGVVEFESNFFSLPKVF